VSAIRHCAELAEGRSLSGAVQTWAAHASARRVCGREAERGTSYAAVLGHWDSERVRRKRDSALDRHSSPKACMTEREDGPLSRAVLIDSGSTQRV
jgi:hypothetical protein